jgi:hypothetical protein
MYAFVLAEPFDPDYQTSHTFVDDRIWDQLSSLAPPPGKSSWFVTVPAGVLIGNEQRTEVELTMARSPTTMFSNSPTVMP